ncbi:hypothetical protein CBR_g3315 [Chara braunii]|uniref:C2 domain-containing protein n=1 Tax=Chara braunii TaxID=69332 RepID=A0A388KFD7_CHABU|nr:hypothetical protein CBR_g3315 [Chara braunii]|eukprot:GBG68775.1 hypothetical protein CBR_g3315 [Chara braunii]
MVTAEDNAESKLLLVEEDMRPLVEGVLRFHIRSMTELNYDCTSVKVFLRILIQALEKRTTRVLVVNGYAVWNEYIHFPISILRDQSHPFNLLSIEIIIEEVTSLHVVLGTLHFHLHEVAKAVTSHGCFNVWSANERVGILDMSIAFLYGLYGYGNSPQLLLHAKMVPEENLTASLLPRLLNLNRWDSQRKPSNDGYIAKPTPGNRFGALAETVRWHTSTSKRMKDAGEGAAMDRSQSQGLGGEMTARSVGINSSTDLFRQMPNLVKMYEDYRYFDRNERGWRWKRTALMSKMVVSLMAQSHTPDVTEKLGKRDTSCRRGSIGPEVESIAIPLTEQNEARYLQRDTIVEDIEKEESSSTLKCLGFVLKFPRFLLQKLQQLAQKTDDDILQPTAIPITRHHHKNGGAACRKERAENPPRKRMAMYVCMPASAHVSRMYVPAFFGAYDRKMGIWRGEGDMERRRRMWTRRTTRIARTTRRSRRDGGGEEMDGGKRGRAGGGGDMDGEEGEDTRKGRRRGGIEDEEVRGGGGDKEDEEGQEEEEEEEETKRRREKETWRMRKGRRTKWSYMDRRCEIILRTHTCTKWSYMA